MIEQKTSKWMKWLLKVCLFSKKGRKWLFEVCLFSQNGWNDYLKFVYLEARLVQVGISAERNQKMLIKSVEIWLKLIKYELDWILSILDTHGGI